VWVWLSHFRFCDWRLSRLFGTVSAMRAAGRSRDRPLPKKILPIFAPDIDWCQTNDPRSTTTEAASTRRTQPTDLVPRLLSTYTKINTLRGVLKHVLAHFTLHHILNYVKPYMLKLIMYSRHIYEKHVLPIPHVYIGSWIAHIELQVKSHNSHSS